MSRGSRLPNFVHVGKGVTFMFLNGPLKCSCGRRPKVIDTRDSGDDSIWRRRECPLCHERMTTYEVVYLEGETS